MRARKAALMETLLPQIEVRIPCVESFADANTQLHPRESGDPESVSTRHKTHTAHGRGPLDPALPPSLLCSFGATGRRDDEAGGGDDARGKNKDSFVLWPQELFPFKPERLWLEIGFGGGEHLAAQAAANPHVGVIGCEPFVNGVASLLAHVDAQNLKNVRVFPNDARIVLDALPESSLDRCFVLFADPWPKKRHYERRFIGPENLPRLARVLKSGGELRLATDVMPLADWMREHTNAHPDFSCVYDKAAPPADWVQTRYEQKGRAAGREPVYLIFKRLP